jgi:uncharacterized protein
MARILILLAIVLVIFWWLRNRASARQAAERPAQQHRAAAGDGDSGQDIEPMVQCAHCGVHLPRAEAIAWHGLHYCRRSHLPEMPGEGDNGARP